MIRPTPLAEGDQPVVIAHEAWLNDDNPARWALAMISCDNPMADCGRVGECAYDGECFRLPRNAKRGATTAQAMFHRYVEALEGAYRIIRATQRADVCARLPGLVEGLERSRAEIESALGRKSERW